MNKSFKQQPGLALAPAATRAGYSGFVARCIGSVTLGSLARIGMVVCLMTSILGTSVFVTCSASGTGIGVILGYVGAAFDYFCRFLWLPLWLAVWILAASGEGERIRLDVGRLFPCLLFAGYSLLQLLIADRTLAAASTERLVGIAPAVLLVLPLCERTGARLFWAGLVVAGVLFCVSLMGSGQMVSVLRGEGFRGTLDSEAGRLDLATDTITSSSILAQCVLALLLLLLANFRKVSCWLVSIPVCVSLGLIAVLTGSKGPVLAFLVSVLAVTGAMGTKRAKYVVMALALLAVGLWIYGGDFTGYEGAVNHLSVGLDDANRQSFYQSVIGSAPTIFGNGVGSWAPSMGYGLGGYVHNSMLEVYYEMGLVGAGLFFWAVGAVGWSLFRAARANGDPIQGFALAYLVYGLTLSMVSGSIFGDGELWVGLLLGCTRFADAGEPTPLNSHCVLT